MTTQSGRGFGPVRGLRPRWTSGRPRAGRRGGCRPRSRYGCRGRVRARSALRTGGGTTQFSKEGRDRVRTALTTAVDISGPPWGAWWRGVRWLGGHRAAGPTGTACSAATLPDPPGAGNAITSAPARAPPAGGGAHSAQPCARSASLGILTSSLRTHPTEHEGGVTDGTTAADRGADRGPARAAQAWCASSSTSRSSRWPTGWSTRDEYPPKIVEGMKEMGIFGLMIPEEYGGAGGVAADLRAHRRGDRPRLDERQRHHQHPLHRGVDAAAARHRGAEAALPAADGDR